MSGIIQIHEMYLKQLKQKDIIIADLKERIEALEERFGIIEEDQNV